MKVFEVLTEYYHPITDVILKETQYVTSEKNTIKSVTDYFDMHCKDYNKELKSIREILTVVEHIGG